MTHYMVQYTHTPNTQRAAAHEELQARFSPATLAFLKDRGQRHGQQSGPQSGPQSSQRHGKQSSKQHGVTTPQPQPSQPLASPSQSHHQATAIQAPHPPNTPLLPVRQLLFDMEGECVAVAEGVEAQRVNSVQYALQNDPLRCVVVVVVVGVLCGMLSVCCVFVVCFDEHV